MKQVTPKDLTFIKHIDGRTWVRLDGQIIHHTKGEFNIETQCKLVWRKFGSIANAAIALAAAPIIWVSHPLFVKPYEY